jgi:hypothetical protein
MGSFLHKFLHNTRALAFPFVSTLGASTWIIRGEHGRGSFRYFPVP